MQGNGGYCQGEFTSAPPEKKNLINPGQYGFLPGRSTISEIKTSMYDRISALEEKLQIYVVFIDYAKAFDLVCHNKLLNNLQAYGFRDSLLKWLRRFLMNRRYTVKVGKFLLLLSPSSQQSSSGKCA